MGKFFLMNSEYQTPLSHPDTHQRVQEIFVCLFVLLLYVPSQQLWSWLDGQFT